MSQTARPRLRPVVVLRDDAGQLESGVDVELREDVAQMGADRVRRDVEPLGGPAVGEPFGDETPDFELGVGQGFPPPVGACGRDEPSADTEPLCFGRRSSSSCSFTEPHGWVAFK